MVYQATVRPMSGKVPVWNLGNLHFFLFSVAKTFDSWRSFLRVSVNAHAFTTIGSVSLGFAASHSQVSTSDHTHTVHLSWLNGNRVAIRIAPTFPGFARSNLRIRSGTFLDRCFVYRSLQIVSCIHFPGHRSP